MTNLQKIRLRLSKVRQRLNEISGLEGEAFTAEIRSEADTLQTEYADLETRSQAAIVGEAEEAAKSERRFAAVDGEGAELRSLSGRVTLGNYLHAARRKPRCGWCRARVQPGFGTEASERVPAAAARSGGDGNPRDHGHLWGRVAVGLARQALRAGVRHVRWNHV